MSELEYYASEFTDGYLDSLADAGGCRRAIFPSYGFRQEFRCGLRQKRSKLRTGEHAPIFRTALRLLIAKDKGNGQVSGRKNSGRKRCTARPVQVGPEPKRKEFEEVKEQLRAHNNRWQEKKSDDRLKPADIDCPAPLEEAVLQWVERVQSLFPPLALEVRRSAFQSKT